MKIWFAIIAFALCILLVVVGKQRGFILTKTERNTTRRETRLQKMRRVCKKKPVNDSYYSPNRLFHDDPTKEIYQDSFNKAWKVSTPANEGMDPEILNKGMKSISDDKYMLSMIIIRNNGLVMERYFHGAKRHHSHNIQSASKSVLSGVFGVALYDKRFKHRLPKDEGTRILDIFPNSLKRLGKFPQNKDMEVFHVLTMTAGFVWDENKTEKYIQYQKNWVHSILGLPHIQEVGEYFIYSSGSAHLISAIVQKKTGMNTCVYAHKNLFWKIGIDLEYWGNDPQGIPTGGFNIFLTPRELARYGLLYLNAGKEGKKQVMTEEWVDDTLWHHIEDVEDVSDPRHYHYGYFWWETEINDYRVFLAWGYRSQFILLIEDMDILIVSTSDTRDYNKKDEEFDIFKFVGNYVIPAVEKRTKQQLKVESRYFGTSLFDFLI